MAGNKKPKKKYNPDKFKGKSVVFTLPLTRGELVRLKAPAHQSMVSLEAGTGTKTDLWNVAFRIRCGFEISKLVYSEETINEFAEASRIADSFVIRGYTQGTEGWFPSVEEMSVLSAAVNAVDEINDTINRNVQLVAYRKALDFQKSLLEVHDPEEARVLETMRADCGVD